MPNLILEPLDPPTRASIRGETVEGTFSIENSWGSIEAAPISFAVGIEDYPAEPYSNGHNRGFERDLSAKLERIQLRKLCLHRNQVIDWFSEAEVVKLEKEAEDKLLGR